MNSESNINGEHAMLDKLERATSRNLPAGVELDSETKQLREGWLVLCRALDSMPQGALPALAEDLTRSASSVTPTASPRFEATTPTLRRRRISPAWPLLAGAAAVVALIALLATWDDDSPKSRPKVANRATGDKTTAAVPTIPKARTPASTPLGWEDSFDQDLNTAVEQIWNVQSENANRNDSRYSEILSQIQYMDQELHGGSL